MKYLEKSFSVPPPEKVTACEQCVYGRGEHAIWCIRRLSEIWKKTTEGLKSCA